MAFSILIDDENEYVILLNLPFEALTVTHSPGYNHTKKNYH